MKGNAGARAGARAAAAGCVLVLVAIAAAAWVSGAVGAVGLGALGPAAARSTTVVAPVPEDAGSYASGQLIVNLADEGGDGAAAGAFRRDVESAAVGVASCRALSAPSGEMGSSVLVSMADGGLTGSGLAAAAEAIAQVRNVASVQPNYLYGSSGAARAALVASDERVAEQYYLDSWESSHGANVAAAWGKMTTSDKVDVAVLDTGVYVMPEYDGNGRLVTNAGKLYPNLHQEFYDPVLAAAKERNVDLGHAVDFVHSDNPASPAPLVNASNPYGDDNGHGTHVSAIVAAYAKTASRPDAAPLGMAGVSPNARVIPVKVLDASGEGSTANLIAAYSYLVGMKKAGKLPNLHVVNMSVSLSFAEGEDDGDGEDDDPGKADASSGAGKRNAGAMGDIVMDDFDGADDDDGPGVPADGTLEAWINKAAAADIVTVCAAGNEGSAVKTFPSDYNACVSVTALDANGATAPFSNVNKFKDISAPGTGIFSAWGGQADAYATLDGTSQATAIVSGVLSMMWAQDPYLTVEEAKTALYETAHEIVSDGSGGRGVVATAPDAASGHGYTALALESVRNGSHGAVDAAAALARVKKAALNVTALKKGDAKLAKASYAYTGKALKPAVTVSSKGRILRRNIDYTVSYGKNVSLGTGKVTVKGRGHFKGTLTCTFKIIAASLSKGVAKLSSNSCVYTGKAKKPSVTVTALGRKLAKNRDYTLSYSRNVNPGTGKVVVKGKGNFAGSLTRTFRICLGTAKVKKLTAAKGSFTARWARQANGNVGYQVRYGLKKNMSGAKVKSVGRNATTQLKVAKLKRGKVYYVQVRTFKKIGSARHYSAWSAVQHVKVR